MYISQYVDYISQPLIQETPAFLEDTTDFLLVIKDVSYSGQTTLMTADVASLYTVIPHNDGLRALEFFLEQRPCQDPATSTILRLAELVLTLNAFEFNEEFYQQTSGVAMGTKMGPSYADLFMAFLEQDLFNRFDLYFPTIYKRFRDDIFIFQIQTKKIFFLLSLHFTGFSQGVAASGCSQGIST